jgi:DNA repair protein RecO (recombination protein O)
MEALVLNRRDFREFDQLISFYTKEKGKVELLARGVKKIVSKNSAHLEPFSYLMVECVQGKELDHLTKVIPINYFPNIRKDLNKSLASGYITSFLEKSVEVGEIDKKIFNLFLSWLKFADNTKKINSILIDGFIINLMSCLGFCPVIDNCVVCEKDFNTIVKNNFKDDYKSGFYFAGGGIICACCRIKKESISEKIVNCGLQEISGIKLLLKADWRIINEFDFSDDEKKALNKLIFEYALFHSEKNIVNWKFHVTYNM